MICEYRLFKYSGYGNATPSVLTVATSLPVDGASPGSRGALGVVRGAASRVVWSWLGGGGAFDAVFLGAGLVCAAGAGCSSAGREIASGARFSSAATS